MKEHEKINYVEFASNDLESTKTFFQEVFSWNFTDYGPDYTAFENVGIDGGFYRENLSTRSENGGALLVFYSSNILETQEKIIKYGGTIIKPIFSFPGGERFHFTEPSGNEYAVWTDQNT